MSESETRLFLILPASVPEEAALSCLSAAAQAGGGALAALLLRAGEAGHDEPRAERIVPAAQALGMAVLIEDDAALAARLGADGVHVRGGARAVKAARAALPQGRIVGGECAGGRDSAMGIGEAGADYLALDQRLEAGGEKMLDWWAELFVVPVVAMHPVPPAAMAELARRRADFVCPPEEIWRGAEDAGRIVRACAQALREDDAR